MTRILGMAFVLGMAGSAWAQEAETRNPDFSTPVINYTVLDPAGAAADDGKLEWGLRLGYLKARDADEGTLMGGIQVRFPLGGGMFAIEGSIDVHASDYEDGDIEIIQWPVQVSLLWFILPKAKITPYVLGGLGWYYTTVDFTGSLEGIDSETDSMFGAHLGLGARLSLGQSMSLSGDLRYIFLEPNEDALDEEDFDTVEFVVSLGFSF